MAVLSYLKNSTANILQKVSSYFRSDLTMTDLSDLQNGTASMQQTLNKVKTQVQPMVSSSLGAYLVVNYKIQQLEGAQVYYVKVFTGGNGNCIHVKVTQPSGSNVFAEEVRQNKNFLSPIEKF